MPHLKPLFFCISLLCCCHFAAAQLPDISSVLKNESPVENLDDPQVKLSQWQKEAKSAFAKLSESNIESQLPPTIDVAALENYRRDLEQIQLGISRYQKISSAAPEARKTLEAARAADTAWLGFSEKPPYSILLSDELANQQDDLQKQAESYRSSLTVFERELNSLQETAKLAEQTSEQLLSSAEKNPNDGGASKWRLDADRAKSRVLATRAFSLKINISLLNDQLETSKARLSLIERQLKIATDKRVFSDDDLVKIKKSSEERKELIRKEISNLAKRQKDTITARNKLQSSFDEVQKTTPEGSQTEATPELTLLNTKLEAVDVKTESLQFISEKLESLVQLESQIPGIYQNRKTLLESNDKPIRAAALAFLKAGDDRLDAWQIVAANELAAVNSDASKQESRAAAIPAEDPRNQAIADLRNALSDKQVILRRVSQAAAYQSRILKRWLVDFDQSAASISLPEKAGLLLESGWKFIKQIWTFPIYEYDKEIMMGGMKSTVPRFIGLGEILKGFAFFGIGYFLANRLKDRLRNFIVGHKYIAESQARTLTNWLMIGVGFLLAIATLNYLALPLTVFAFLGGALLIGVGFGTQTLIKNFISGIIVLFERKIRVGDIVDIGSGPGKIIEINTRSSILRSGDGKETLVPNSLFLENKVTSLTLTNRKVRQSIKITSTLAATPQAVSDVLKDCAERHGRVLKDPAPSVTLDDFSDKSNTFTVFYWIEANDKTNIYVVASDIRFMIERRFSEMKIKATPETVTVAASVIPENPEA
jgi:potassium-dependent mechanosensitive channel